MKKEEFKQTLESFFVSKFGIKFGSILPNNFNKLLESTISQSIAEHEDSQWKKYPKDKPNEMTLYLCQCKTEVWDSRKKYTNPYGFGYLVFGGWQIINDKELEVIAFRELPKPYQEERQSFGNPN